MKYIVGDIGNTLTKIALLNNKFEIIKSINLETKKYLNKKKLINEINKLTSKDVNANILFSSVVPKLLKIIKSSLKKKKYKVYEIKDFNIKKLIKFNVKKIKQVGSDRIANAIGAYNNDKINIIVIDFGTATTFDIIKKGIYSGGVIAPGINLSISNLNKETALLPILKLRSNTKSYGKNTLEALNSGFLWGYQGLINNIIKKISSTGKNRYKVILTGGYAALFRKYIKIKTNIDQNITIKGIIKIYKEFLL